MVGHHPAEFRENIDGSLHRPLIEAPITVDSLAEAGDPHQSFERTPTGVDHEKPGGVGAAVDRGYWSASSSGRPLTAGGSSDAIASRVDAELVTGPPANRIGTARQEPREMSMEAFHTATGPRHAARRPRPAVPRWYRGVSKCLVAGMGYLELGGVDCSFGGPNPARRLEPADRLPLGPPHKPVPRGHGRAVREKRGVQDDDRPPGGVADDDLEGSLGRPSEQPGDGLPVALAHRRRRRSE